MATFGGNQGDLLRSRFGSSGGFGGFGFGGTGGAPAAPAFGASSSSTDPFAGFTSPPPPTATGTRKRSGTTKKATMGRTQAAKLKENYTCKNIRSEDEFRMTGGCATGTVRSWGYGGQTFVKTHNEPTDKSKRVVRNVMRDDRVQFAEESGIRKAILPPGQLTFETRESGLLRAKDNTMIEYSQLNSNGPRDLYFDCRRADDCDYSAAGVKIGKKGGAIHYTRTTDEFNSIPVTRPATPVHFKVVREQRKAERDREAEEREQRRQERLAAKMAKAGAEERKMSEAFTEAALKDEVFCRGIRSSKQLSGSEACPPGIVRQFRDSKLGEDQTFVKLPRGHVRDVRSVQIGHESGLDLHTMTKAEINAQSRYGLEIGCEDEDTCAFDSAPVKITRPGGNVNYVRRSARAAAAAPAPAPTFDFSRTRSGAPFGSSAGGSNFGGGSAGSGAPTFNFGARR